MHSLGTLLLSFALVASQTWAASINVHQVPRTLQDPESFKRSNLDARDGAGFSPFERKDLFPRQSCTDTEVTCLENKCCPDGFDCYYYTGGVGCCPTGNTCTGEFRFRLPFFFFFFFLTLGPTMPQVLLRVVLIPMPTNAQLPLEAAVRTVKPAMWTALASHDATVPASTVPQPQAMSPQQHTLYPLSLPP